MRHIVDLTKLHNERGEGINTNGKIHVRMGEDSDGNIYFGGLNEDTGPECIDPSSYVGAFWYRFNPKLDKVEVLGKISRHFGLLGMVYEPIIMVGRKETNPIAIKIHDPEFNQSANSAQ